MASSMIPAVAMGVMGPRNYGYYGAQSFPMWSTPDYFVGARTPWVRLWVRWDYLQPRQAFSDPATDTANITRNGQPVWDVSPATYLAYLDANIQVARSYRRGVIVTIYGIPAWANAGTISAAGTHLGDDALAAPDLNTINTHSGPFANFVYQLATRWNTYAPKTAGISVDVIEAVNEPNQQWWPQSAEYRTSLQSASFDGPLVYFVSLMTSPDSRRLVGVAVNTRSGRRTSTGLPESTFDAARTSYGSIVALGRSPCSFAGEMSSCQIAVQADGR